MKLNIISFFDRTTYTILTLTTIISLYLNSAISLKSQEIQPWAVTINSINPFQHLSNALRSTINYISNFANFQKQLAEFENLSLQLQNALNEKDAWQQNMNLFQELTQTYTQTEVAKQGTVVALQHSTNGNIIEETTFESPEKSNIKIGSVIINNNCILGRVYKQEGNLNYALLYTDSKFRLPVYTEKTRIFGMIYGGLPLQFKSFTNSDDEKIEENEALIIAPANQTLAEGLKFGTISDTSQRTVESDCLNYYKYAIAI